MFITVFTPTYNRGYIIGKLYESLKRQTFKDFEWLIVDDGSTDNTEEIVSNFIKENPFFPIRYIKTENGGKHRAINCAVRLANGDMFFIVDSDDYLPDDSLEIIKVIESSIPSEQKDIFAGICGQRFYQSGNAVGRSFKDEYIDATTLERSKYGILGDKAEVYYTRILKRFPFPEIEGEKFCTESIVWDRISNEGYKLRFFNQNIYICEYRNDGLTSQGLALYAKNPKQWGIAINQDYRLGKTSFYEKSIEVYKYYLTTKKRLSFSQVSYNTSTNLICTICMVAINRILDYGRKLLGLKTIKESCFK